MQSSRIVMDRQLPRLVSCLALLFWVDTAIAADTRASPGGGLDSPEEIAITGRRNLISLNAEIIDAEARMFDLFNELNDKREFDIRCEEAIVTGSRIPERECVPVYMKRARMTAAQRFLFFDLTPPGGENSSGPARNGGAISMNTRGAPQLSEEQLWFHNNEKHTAFNARFRELAAQNPELASVALDLQAKRQLVEAYEARQRQESTLGRLFAAFGGKDDE